MLKKTTKVPAAKVRKKSEKIKPVTKTGGTRAAVSTARGKSVRSSEKPSSPSKKIQPVKTPMSVPAILLEGDDPTPVAASGPGEKFSLGSIPPKQKFSGDELPESYGTKQLFLTARDPHWLYVRWDLTDAQQKKYNAEASDGHLILRIFAEKIAGDAAYEIHVHPDSRHWFAHVERAGCSYIAELGFYSPLGKWTRVAASSGTLAPPDAEAGGTAEFATIPYEYPFARLMQIVGKAVHGHLPTVPAPETPATKSAATRVTGELPESYGTKKLFLAARDPHWLYAHWDFSAAELSNFVNENTDGQLTIRVFAEKTSGHPLSEIQVRPESRHWFTHVERAGTAYVAELGGYSSLGKWTRLAVSSDAVTPSDTSGGATAAEFATIPFECSYEQLAQIVSEAANKNLPLAQALEELRRSGHSGLPKLSHSIYSPIKTAGVTWTKEHAEALARIVKIDDSRRVWIGSLEITELIRRRLNDDATSLATGFGASSPMGQPSEKSFFFNLNAEVIIYGATEPNAKVTIGGQQIKLRPDGSFTFRFSLPDGTFELPAVAVSADGTEARAAELKLSRETTHQGEVGTHPQDPSLKPPLPGNLK